MADDKYDVISVLIVEDLEETLRRMSDAILADPALRLLGAASTGAAGIALMDESPPDVLLVDLGLPDMNGIELIRHAAARHRGTDCVVVTLFADEANVISCIEAGAVGYLLKDSASGDIAAIVRDVHAGNSPISPGIARYILRRFPPAIMAGKNCPAPGLQALTDREREVLKLVAKGFSFAEVAETLAMSTHTVVTHVKKIYRKLSVHSRGEAVFEATQLGLL